MGRHIERAHGAGVREAARGDRGKLRTLETASALAFATAVASIVFIAAPVIDQAAARAFHATGLGFPLSQEPALKVLRWLGRAVPAIALGAVVALLAVRVVRRKAWTWLSDAGIAYVLSVFAFAPLLMSNLLLKGNWGRPRPSQTDLFGGNLDFTPAWRISGQCAWNCSFVSGEASMSMALAAFAFLLPKPQRPLAIAVVCAWTSLISWNRMAFGAHYLSDVALAAGLTAIVALALKALLLDRAGDVGLGAFVGAPPPRKRTFGTA
ncbi:MAG: phosphatase PAP2 family protein [Hyphomicrobium sp.]